MDLSLKDWTLEDGKLDNDSTAVAKAVEIDGVGLIGATRTMVVEEMETPAEL